MSELVHYQQWSIKLLLGRKRGRAAGSSSALWCPGSVGLALVPVSSGL